MATEQPNWDNLGRGEVGRDGGRLFGVATTPRIGGLTAEGLRSSRTQTAPILGGSEGLTWWEKTNAQLLSDPGYAFGTW